MPLYERLTAGSRGGGPEGVGDVGYAVGAGDVERLTAQSRHDARVDADAAGIFGEGDIAHPMVLVFDRPVIADGGGEGLGGQHDGGCVEGCLPARGPLSGGGGTNEGLAFDAHDGGDQRRPLGLIER